MKHICGLCKQEFTSEEDYLSHSCPRPTAAPPAKLSESDLLAAVVAARRQKKSRG